MAEPDERLPRASRRVAETLASRGHRGEVRVLESSAGTAADAAAALGVEQRQIVKSMVFRGARSGEPVLALVGGTSRVSSQLLANHLGEPVERADAAWVRERTGFSIGGVPPLAHREPLRTVADTGLVAIGELWAAAGTPHAVFPLSGGELESLIGAELAAIGEADAPAQPVGPALTWTARAQPSRAPMEGAHIRLRPPEPVEDAVALYAPTHAPAGDPTIWTYLSDGPFESAQALRDALVRWRRLDDPLNFTLVDARDGRPLGMASYMRIAPEHGVVEIGRIWFLPALQRTTAATEAIYLLARRAFDEQGYRRLEWKCDALNEPSRRAAERFGFSFEGIFRRHMVVKGRSRDTAWYAITDDGWPAVAEGFRAWLDAANFDQRGVQRARLGDLIAAARARAQARPQRGTIRVERAVTTSAELVTAVARLVGDLSASASPPGAEQVAAIVDSPACHLLIARGDDGAIVGMLTLVVFPIPTGVRAWIEDVVVSPGGRGRGVGAALSEEALRLAAERGARTVDLTSRPSREAANRLYQRLGFERRETNVYRHSGPPLP